MLFLNREQSKAAGRLQQHPDKQQQQQKSFQSNDIYSVRSKLDPSSYESVTQWPTVSNPTNSATNHSTFPTLTSATDVNTEHNQHQHHHRIRSSMPFAVSAVSAFTTLFLLTIAGHAANATDLTSSGDPSSSSRNSRSISESSSAFSANTSSGGWTEGPMSDEQRIVYNRLMEVEFGSSVIPRRPRRSPMYQNEFAVYIPSGAEAADAVAGKYGFTNKGQVSFVCEEQ